jgi:hypothetical protein
MSITLEDLKKEFGLTSQLAGMQAMIRVTMATQMMNDIEAGKIPESSVEILRAGCARLLENQDMTGLQTTHRQYHYWDKGPDVPKPDDKEAY